ncbi:Alkaline phosphatase [Shewanella halifaxensis HAW-EB4]|uniref:Alkaline phosphatase n=1 Tax=Shewanella halifaxensis (strain HAW-EB4) TaxID=458817 RepID=B0TIR3_SHEHH|nr:alkaline phosphatase [Shewanella halifaxensis]ABZ75608.1 Alkaline phosphatase [Shewanella halifaxensis HAW-EB4]
MTNLNSIVRLSAIYSSLLCASLWCTSAQAQPDAPFAPVIVAEYLPRNIIYLIGDGMGPAYTSAYRFYNDNPQTQRVEKTIFDQLLVGMSSTYPDDDTYVTDSAAAATALATSYKTYNGAISVDHQGGPFPTLLEMAKAQGKTTAVVVTSQINHATPASFLAHNESRRNYDQIADSYLSNLIDKRPVADLMLGGGTQYFARNDRDLTLEFQEYGYHYIDSLSDLSSIENLPALGLFAPKGLPYAIESQDPLRLTTMTRKALSLLSNQEAPFVMMVEASHIDWCGHSNDIACAMNEMDDFANTLSLVKRYVDSHPDTLLVATADHSTGGLTLGRDGTYQWQGQLLHQVHSLPSTISQLIIANPEVLNDLAAFSAFLRPHISIDIEDRKMDGLRKMLNSRLSHHKHQQKIEDDLKQTIDKLTYTGWTTGGHDAIDVPVYAYGQGALYFRGHKDNSEIAATLIQMVQDERYKVK